MRPGPFVRSFLLLFLPVCSLAQNYPDQQYVLRLDSLVQNIETIQGMTLSSDGKSLTLEADRTEGFVILKPQYAQSPFDQGLPSWNGSAPDINSSFKVQMRFPYDTTWSPWLTVGYWKDNLWSSYGATSYAGGVVDVDYVKLNSYVSAWQFKIIMTRTSVYQPLPTVHKLNFFVSDSRTTTLADYTRILSEAPGAILITTDFIYQYGVDPNIGGDICSPTSVSMILRSYKKSVDPRQFALDTYDPYWKMFGVWPKVVQNASGYGLDGAVTRYRSWSQAREVLANGGRIAMSVSKPLYTGHLMMLAGFASNGDPIVHDPARTDGYAHIFNKSDLSHSWFDKGGIAYTFYPADTGGVTAVEGAAGIATEFALEQNWPNPFNPSTNIAYTVDSKAVHGSEFMVHGTEVKLTVYDLLGREVAVLVNERQAPGTYTVRFDGSRLASGTYLYRLQAGAYVETKKMLLIR